MSLRRETKKDGNATTTPLGPGGVTKQCDFCLTWRPPGGFKKFGPRWKCHHCQDKKK